MMPITAILIFLGSIEVMLALHPSYMILLLLYLEDQICHIGTSEIFVILHEDLQLLLSLHSFVQIFVQEVCS